MNRKTTTRTDKSYKQVLNKSSSKRLLSMLLCMTMLSTATVPAYAEPRGPDNGPTEVIPVNNEDNAGLDSENSQLENQGLTSLDYSEVSEDNFTESSINNANDVQENIDDDNEESDGFLDEDAEFLNTSDNIVGFIPENHETLQDDLGLNDCLIADLNAFSTFSLRPPTTNVVELEVPFDEGESIDVLHFIEHSENIEDDAMFLDVSDCSRKTKKLLSNAIAAYQEKFDSNDEAVAIEIFNDLEVEDSKVSFEPESFSIFAVGDIHITTYEFYVDGNLWDTQYLMSQSGQDVLLHPETPIKTNSEFLGWEIEGETSFQTFGTIDVSTSIDQTIKCHAVFNEVAYVYFLYEAKENADILETLSGKPGDVIYTEQIDYPINLDKHVVSWHTDVECLSPDVTSITLGAENIRLYPKVEKGYWITFYTEGGSYVDPMFYAKNETIIKPADPVREGYDFVGWFDENGTEFVFNNQIVTESTRLTARYEAKLVNYTVQLVTQNPDIPGQYDAVLNGMVTKQALCGSSMKATDITDAELDALIAALPSSSYLKTNLNYFYYSDTKNNAESVAIESDGSSVLYIYYDRHPVEVNYYLSYSDTTPWLTQSGLYDGLMPTEHWPKPDKSEFSSFGDWESSNNVYPSWTGRYRFAFKWDSAKEKYVFNVYAVKGVETEHILYSYVQAINPDGTVPDVGIHVDDLITKPSIGLYHPNTPGNENIEAFSKNWADIDFETTSNSSLTNNGTWVLHETMKVPSTLTTEHATLSYTGEWYPGFTAIAFGFDLFHKNSGETTDYRVNSFADRAWPSYIAYLTKNANGKWVEDGKATGSDYKTSAGGAFHYLMSDKWYAVRSPYKVVKMYGNAYIRFLRNHYNLQFIADGNEVANFDEVYYETNLGIDKFKAVQESLTPPAGFVFDGWFTSSTLTEDTRFNLDTNTMPANDLILYAKWKAIQVELDVHVTIDGTDEIIDGFNSFTVKYGDIVDKDKVDSLRPSVNVPTDAIWYGWYEKINVGGGKDLLVPFNFDKQLVEDIVLYPFFSHMTPVKVSYDLNGGSGTTPVDVYNYALGRGAIVLSNANIVPPAEKVFVCWNTAADGSGKSYYPGDIALINSNNMSLYAIYGPVSHVDEAELIYVNTISSEEASFKYTEIEKAQLQNSGVFTTPISPKYIFKNWNTKEDGSGITYNVGDYIYLSGVGNKLYTVWDVDVNYDISLTYINPLNSEEKTFDYTKLDSIVIKDAAVFDNAIEAKYIFNGWNTKADGSGISYQPNDIPSLTGEVKLYAMLEADPNYKLTVNYINNLTAEEHAIAYPGVNTAAAMDQTVFTTPVDSKYLFVGWNTKTDGTGASYKAGDTICHLGDINMYAVWTIDPNYKMEVTYVNVLTSEEKIFEYFGVDQISLQDTSIFSSVVDSKYKFKGWNTKADGSGVNYSVGDIVGDANSIRVYAVWEDTTPKPSSPSSSSSSSSSSKKLTYTVYYKDANGNEIGEREQYEGRLDDVITISAKNIDGFICKDGEKSLKITSNIQNNVVVFEYHADSTSPEPEYLESGSFHKRYIVGYEDGTVKPLKKISRAESAAIFYRLLKEDVRAKYSVAENNFSDVKKEQWFNTAVSTLNNLGILTGYTDGTFKPNQNITRAEFITLMVSFFEAENMSYQNVFTDVLVKDWFYDSVGIGVNNGFIHGYPDNTFKPNQPITRAEASHIINNSLNRKPSNDGLLPGMQTWPDCHVSDWFYLDMQEATNSHSCIHPEASEHEQWTELKMNEN